MYDDEDEVWDAEGRINGPAADVYSLGVCCFLALTGTDPFDFDGGEDNEDGSFCLVDSYAGMLERLEAGDVFNATSTEGFHILPRRRRRERRRQGVCGERDARAPVGAADRRAARGARVVAAGRRARYGGAGRGAAGQRRILCVSFQLLLVASLMKSSCGYVLYVASMGGLTLNSSRDMSALERQAAVMRELGNQVCMCEKLLAERRRPAAIARFFRLTTSSSKSRSPARRASRALQPNSDKIADKFSAASAPHHSFDRRACTMSFVSAIGTVCSPNLIR